MAVCKFIAIGLAERQLIVFITFLFGPNNCFGYLTVFICNCYSDVFSELKFNLFFVSNNKF